jgi:hypothetical protein
VFCNIENDTTLKHNFKAKFGIKGQRFKTKLGFKGQNFF